MKIARSMQIISDIKTHNNSALTDMAACMRVVEDAVKDAGAKNLGVVKHVFPENGGFTLVMCLAESHIALHTWPELNCLTLDVYLCNYTQNNTEKCESIFQEILSYFEPETHNTTRLLR